MDALFFRKICRGAFIILDTKAFSIFAFNNVLNERTRPNRHVCINLLQFVRLYNLNVNAPLYRILREFHFRAVGLVCERAFYSIFGNCKRDEVNNVAAKARERETEGEIINRGNW